MELTCLNLCNLSKILNFENNAISVNMLSVELRHAKSEDRQTVRTNENLCLLHGLRVLVEPMPHQRISSFQKSAVAATD